jgi:hypothetical protein
MQRATAAWERTVPKQTLRWGANVLFRHPPHIPSAERMALTPDPAPALRAALTPGPSPALRERGSCGLGIVDRRGRRIATATLSPATPLVDAAGGRGKVWGIIPPFLSRAAGEEGGWGGR